MKRYLYLMHRWLGIALGLFVLAWVVSGVVMLFVGYPKLTPAEHLARLAPLDAGCCIAPGAALVASGDPRTPLSLRLTGAGGSLVALPLLLSLHLPLRDAIGVSLGAVAMSALIGAIPRARLGQVAWRPVVLLALCGLPGNAAGQWLGQFIPERTLIIGFCLLVLWSAWRMWRGASLPAKENTEDRYPALLGIGLGVGLLSGLMGVGGGFLIVPALLWFTSLSLLSAMATSMAVIAVVSGGGFLLYLTDAEPPLALLGGLALGGAFGVLSGNRLAQYLNSSLLQRLFALMLVLVSLSLGIQKLLLGH